MKSPEKLIDVLSGPWPSSLRELFSLVATQLDFSALGFVRWDRRKRSVSVMRDAFWRSEDVHGAEFLRLAEESALLSACAGPAFSYLRTSPDLTGRRLVQLGLCPMRIPRREVLQQLPEGMVFCLVYVSKALVLGEDGLPRLSFDTRNWRIVTHFAGAYARLTQGTSLARRPVYAGLMMEQAMTLTLLRSVSAKVSEADELVHLAFSIPGGTAYGVALRDGEMERNRKSYFAFSQSVPAIEQNEWLVFGDGEKLGEGGTQNEALLRAQEALKDKPGLRIYLFRKGGRLRRLGAVPADPYLEPVSGKL